MYPWPFFGIWIYTCMPITVIAYMNFFKSFFRVKFFASTCYKGAHKYLRREMLKKDEYLWTVGKWKGLCPGCDCFSSAEKVPQTWMWTNTQKTYYARFKFYIMLPLPQTCAQGCSKSWYCQLAKLGQGLLVWGILAIRETRLVKFCQKQSIEGL